MRSSHGSAKLHDKSSLRRRAEQLMVRSLAIVFSAASRVLPLRSLHSIGNAVGWVVFRVVPRRRRLGLENMRAVFGDRYEDRELRRLLLRSAQNMAKTMLELLKMPTMSQEQFERFAPVTGEEHLREADERGNGVIIVTAHFGNWEALGARIVSLGIDLTVVARDADDTATASIVNTSREAMGERVVGRKTVREMLRLLRAGDALGLLPDQHALDGRLWLPFLGRPASTHAGPATLAGRTGAAIVPAFAVRQADDSLQIRFHPPISPADTGDREQDIRITTGLINEIIGQQIIEHPDQWLWMHRRWRTPPPDVEADHDEASSPAPEAMAD